MGCGGTLSNKMSFRGINPRLRTSLRVLLAAFVITLLSSLAASSLQGADKKALIDLLQAAREIMPGILNADKLHLLAKDPVLQIQQPFLDPHFLFGAFIFSAGSVWIALRIVGPGQLIMILQLLVLSIGYQIMLKFAFNTEGRPLSTALVIAAAALCGKAMKARDNQSRTLEAKQIELKLRYEELQESRLALVKQDESERRLLAADLHDQVLNDMRSIQKKFEAYSKNPSPDAGQEIETLLKASMSHIREIMDDLCPVLLEEFGLPAAIEDRLDKAAQQGGFRVRFSQLAADEKLDALSAVEKQLVYRLIQESLNNVCKHSQAKMVKVTVEEQDSQLIISVIDDGVGIDFNKLKESSRGTVYMRLRAALIGAKVAWKPGQDGKGTCVEIRLDVQSSSS